MTVSEIARIAHEANRAYCAVCGDFSQLPWEDAPEWQRKSAVAGVGHVIANPDTTPDQTHESWLRCKEVDGWVYGETKDPEKKQHPCMVPYEKLPEGQRTKDHLYLAVVRTLIPYLNEQTNPA